MSLELDNRGGQAHFSAATISLRNQIHAEK
jgi:hypothetical protein